MGMLSRAYIDLCDGLTSLTLNRNTMQQAKSSVEGLCTIIDHHYQEILDRVKALERQNFSQASEEIIPSKLDNRLLQSEQPAMVYPMDNSVIKRASRNSIHFSFEKDLFTTRLYQKIKFRRSIPSLVSVEEPATRWSTISGLSTIDGVSRLSVLNLAITPAEVYNHSRYTTLLTNAETHTFPQPSEEINQAEGQRDPPSPQPSEEVYQAEGQRDPPSPQPSEEIYQTEGQRDPRIIRNFKSFDVAMEDPTSRVLPAALRKYNINANWRDYDLYIVYDDQRRRLGLSEKPLVLFKQLDREGRRPMFMLRRNIHSRPTHFK